MDLSFVLNRFKLASHFFLQSALEMRNFLKLKNQFFSQYNWKEKKKQNLLLINKIILLMRNKFRACVTDRPLTTGIVSPVLIKGWSYMCSYKFVELFLNVHYNFFWKKFWTKSELQRCKLYACPSCYNSTIQICLQFKFLTGQMTATPL